MFKWTKNALLIIFLNHLTVLKSFFKNSSSSGAPSYYTSSELLFSVDDFSFFCSSEASVVAESPTVYKGCVLKLKLIKFITKCISYT